MLDHAVGNPLELEEHASGPLAGGIMLGYQCGQVWGSTLAAGAEAYRRFGSGPEAEARALAASQKIIESFTARAKRINCREITKACWARPGTIVKYFVSGGVIKCFNMAAKYAPEALESINSTFSAPIRVPPTPVSCAALLAQKMGALEMHQVMASGFAGGIGLSGAGCGVLGAAIWLRSMKDIEAGFNNKDIMLKTTERVKAFEEVSSANFECVEIVGRKFKDIDDHAVYLRGGGCAKLIEAVTSIP